MLISLHMDNLKSNTGSYCFTFCEVIELKITEAATRVHQIPFRATHKKSEQPTVELLFSLFLRSSFVFVMGNESALYMCVRRAVRKKVKTEKAGKASLLSVYTCDFIPTFAIWGYISETPPTYQYCTFWNTPHCVCHMVHIVTEHCIFHILKGNIKALKFTGQMCTSVCDLLS